MRSHKSYEYDMLGRLLQIKANDPTRHSQKTILRDTEYDNMGNVIAESSNGVGAGQTAENATYVYDELNRLVETTINNNSGGGPGKKHAYSYDSLGNILSEFPPNGNKTTSNTYNKLNQLIASNKDGDDYSYSYDLRGNLAEVVYHGNGNNSNKIVEQYVYDATNMMTSGVNESGEESHYIYNGLGHLVTNEWVTDKNAYGYTGVSSIQYIEAAEEILFRMDAVDVTDIQLYDEKVKQASTGVSLFAGPQLQNVRKDFVLDYTTPLKNV